MRYLLLIIALFFASSLAAAASLTTIEDLAHFSVVSDPVISHDGRRVVFVVKRMDVKENRYRTTLWLVSSDATDSARQLTQGDDDSDPQWAADDHAIIFVRQIPEKDPQIYRIALDGGEAQRLTNLEHGASSPRISHNGKLIAFTVSTTDSPSQSEIDWKALGITPSSEQRQSDIRRIDRLNFEFNGAGFTYDHHDHIWVMNADGSDPRALTSGHEWSEGSVSWSYDDRTLAFTTLRHEDVSNSSQDIYTISVAGGVMQRVPIPWRAGANPVWTHAGTLLYLFDKTEDPGELSGVAAIAPDGSTQHTIIPLNQLSFGDAMLSDLVEGGAGCNTLLGTHDDTFTGMVSVPGATELRRFDLATGESRHLVGGDGEIFECSMNADGTKLAYDWSDMTHPTEVFFLDTSSGATRRLSALNATLAQKISTQPAEPFAVHDNAGFEIHAWIMHPPNATPGRRYPTLLEIHGGPATEFGNTYFHEFQVLAARGYNIVFADPRGSVGFGYPLEAGLDKDWGDPMFADEMAVMDAVVKRPEVDSERLGVLGGSYGGYATLWIIGHTHRFKVAVAERAVANMVSWSLAYDGVSSIDSNFSWGEPWDHLQSYWHQSPLASVTNVTTPLLILHSDNDIRTPWDETVQFYSALKILHKPVEYINVPRDNHDLSRTGEPQHRLERLHIIADWLDAHLK